MTDARGDELTVSPLQISYKLLISMDIKWVHIFTPPICPPLKSGTRRNNNILKIENKRPCLRHRDFCDIEMHCQ